MNEILAAQSHPLGWVSGSVRYGLSDAPSERHPGYEVVQYQLKLGLNRGKIKCGRIVKRASGWYLCLFIDAQPKPIPVVANGVIGIDPGFNSLLTFSTGEKIDHPREFKAAERRLGQAQRGDRKKLAARMQERIREVDTPHA